MRPIEAVFHAGALVPAEALALREGEAVRLVFVRRGDPSRWDLSRMTSVEDAELASAGLAAWADAFDREDRG